MVLKGSKLYVADTENHLIRVLDLGRKVVTTLAGIGKQAMLHGKGGRLHSTALNSPWDLLIVRDTLYIAMAGCHQIWSHTFGTDHLQPWAGTGRENVVNGLREEADFAQPSGLASDEKALFVADSEGSAIRSILFFGGAVSTLAGTSDLDGGRSLFQFGDESGVGMNARFQHPLGIAYNNGRIFVADSYNHKIKSLDVASGDVKTWLGTGHRGDSLDPPEFSEPGGLSVAADTLFVADTNNHAIKACDIATRTVRELKLDGLKPPVPASGRSADGEEEKQRPRRLKYPHNGSPPSMPRLEFSFLLPGEYKLNKLAPANCRLQVLEGAELFKSGEDSRSHAAIEGDKAVVIVPLTGKAGKGMLEATLTYTYCREGVGGLCKLGTARWTVPVEVASDAKQTAVKLIADASAH